MVSYRPFVITSDASFRKVEIVALYAPDPKLILLTFKHSKSGIDGVES